MGTETKRKVFRITRTVIELFEIEAKDKAEALYNCGIEGGPYSVTVKKETVKEIKSK